MCSLFGPLFNRVILYLIGDRLGGVMVKASASRAEDSGSIPGRVMPKTLKNGILVAVPPAPGTMGYVLRLVGPVSV